LWFSLRLPLLLKIKRYNVLAEFAIGVRSLIFDKIMSPGSCVDDKSKILRQTENYDLYYYIGFKIINLARIEGGSCIVIPRRPITQSKLIILKPIDKKDLFHDHFIRLRRRQCSQCYQRD
jgi:hypothetical protein